MFLAKGAEQPNSPTTAPWTRDTAVCSVPNGFICSRRSVGPVITIPRIWLMHWIFTLMADRRATRRQRIDSTIPLRDLGVVADRPEATACAAGRHPTGQICRWRGDWPGRVG
jgi:hypothetical protein